MGDLADIRTEKLCHTCQDRGNAEMYFRKKRGVGQAKIEDWFKVAEGRVQWRTTVNMVMNCVMPKIS